MKIKKEQVEAALALGFVLKVDQYGEEYAKCVYCLTNLNGYFNITKMKSHTKSIACVQTKHENQSRKKIRHLKNTVTALYVGRNVRRNFETEKGSNESRNKDKVRKEINIMVNLLSFQLIYLLVHSNIAYCQGAKVSKNY